MSASTQSIAQRYQRDGFICPLPALTKVEADRLLSELEAAERSLGSTLGKAEGQLRAKTHLLFPWLYELCFHPAILRPVQQILGPDLLLYHVTCWLKEPGDPSFVSWHQDGTYFYLEPPEHVTAWVALTDSNLDSGCVQVLPGTHALGQLQHQSVPDRANLLSNGQHAEGEFDASNATPLILQAGQISLHDTFIVHSSGPNRSTKRRIGIGLSYIPTRVSYRGGRRVGATLVSGIDHYNHFQAEQPPAESLDTAARAFHANACQRFFAGHGATREDAKQS